MNHDCIILSRLRFFSRHGIFPEEIERGQHFEVTVRLELPLAAAGRTDDLAQTVDYRDMHEVVRRVLEGPSRKLAECLAESVAADLLRRFPTVAAVEIELSKPNPPVSFHFAGFFVCIRRERARLPSPVQPQSAPHPTCN